MRIEFDEAKRSETIKARGLDMTRTAEVFRWFDGDRRRLRRGSPHHHRFLDEAMAVLVWTRRDDAHRIISMRKANERERRIYGPRF